MNRRKFIWIGIGSFITFFIKPNEAFLQETETHKLSGIRLARLQPAEEGLKESADTLVEALSDYEKGLLEQGLVNILDIDSTLLVKLKYASADNFMGADVYEDLRNCYLQPEAARMLKAAHDLLKERRPDLRLLVVDGFRPRRVQRRMWSIVEGTPMQRYVANPATGSMHNHGVAVDITLADLRGNALDMGTSVDHFGILAQPREEMRFLKEGKLTPEHIANRRLLREVMTAAGFRQLPIEWWHFDATDRQSARNRYPIID